VLAILKAWHPDVLTEERTFVVSAVADVAVAGASPVATFAALRRLLSGDAAPAEAAGIAAASAAVPIATAAERAGTIAAASVVVIADGSTGLCRPEVVAIVGA